MPCFVTKEFDSRASWFRGEKVVAALADLCRIRLREFQALEAELEAEAAALARMD